MRIAIPFAGERLATHFGHCEYFALIDADGATNGDLRRMDLEAPAHEPGLLPKWLAGHGVDVVIAGGMGRRARDLFDAQDIRVVVGAPADTPEDLAKAYLAGSLKTGENVCDH